jgi:hypothetical protein
MKDTQYKVVKQGFTDASQVSRGDDLFYRCEICQDVIPSTPKENVRCQCRNIAIDVEYIRLFVKDFSKFTLTQKLS